MPVRDKFNKIPIKAHPPTYGWTLSGAKYIEHDEPCDHKARYNQMLLDGKMLEAFGATLQHSDDGDKNHVLYRWIKVAHLKCQHYDLPGGATGQEFVSQLSKEVSRLARGECGSERLIIWL